MGDVLIENIPSCLRQTPQWVCWRQEDHNGSPRKVPYGAKTGRTASSTDPASWCTFEQAVAAYGRGGYSGIGFVFAADGPYAGLDLDNCLDETGSLTDWAREIVTHFKSYCEISPSGRGVKMFLRGRKPEFAQCSVKNLPPDETGEVEIYDRARYFTVTGRLLPGSPVEVSDRQAELDELCEFLWPPKEQPSPASKAAPPAESRIADCLKAMLAMNVTDKFDGSFRLFSACCRCVEHDLTDDQAVSCIRAYEAQRPFPKSWTDAQVLRRLRDAERKVRRGEAVPAGGAGAAGPQFKSVRELLRKYPALRQPVIYGLLREGETMNIISAPKVGKSWLVTDLALAVATGRPWLDAFETVQGDVLILDNELHGETSANRIPRVAEARGIELDEIADSVFVENLRGRLQDIFALRPYFGSIEPGRFKIVVLDAFYRFVPRDTDENDNGTMAQLYNHLDHYAAQLGCSFVLIHHSSKGSQSGKAITDVGAGAGAQSRAVDTHLILRPHEEDGAVVLDAAVRSWPPVEARSLRWEFPVWTPADDLDPAELRSDGKRRKQRKEPAEPLPPEPAWDAERFVAAFLTTKPKIRAAILEAAEAEGLSERKALTLLRRAEGSGLAHRWAYGPRKPVAFATVPQPKLDLKEPQT